MKQLKLKSDTMKQRIDSKPDTKTCFPLKPKKSLDAITFPYFNKGKEEESSG